MTAHDFHDPGDEDRRPIFVGPWCERCGDAFDGPERPCPHPHPGEPYVDCGRGGHMFRLTTEPTLAQRFRNRLSAMMPAEKETALARLLEFITPTDDEIAAEVDAMSDEEIDAELGADGIDVDAWAAAVAVKCQAAARGTRP